MKKSLIGFLLEILADVVIVVAKHLQRRYYKQADRYNPYPDEEFA